MIPKRKPLAFAAIAFAAFAMGSACAAHAAEPLLTRPVRLIVGFGPGTSVDIVARIVAAKVQASVQQSIIIDNKPGAGSIVGLREVARAAPDGYTLAIAAMPNISIAPAINPDLGFDPERELAPVVGVADSDLVLAVNQARTPVAGLKEFVSWAREHQPIFYGTLGAGTLGHFGGVVLSDATGFKMDLVHYKGASDGLTGLVSGDIQAMLLASSVAQSQAKAGHIKVLASTGSQRSASFPNVPTFGESGYPAMQFGAWYGIFAPAGTPDAVLDKLAEAFASAARDPDVRARMEAAGFFATGTTRAEFARAVREDTKRWAEVARAANLDAK